MSESYSENLGHRIDGYIEGLFNSPDPILKETLAELERAGLPSINVSPNEGKLLNMLARLHGAAKMVEIGTLAGYSAIWLGRALPPGGKLITLEVDAKHAEVSRRNLARAGLSGKVEVRLGPALDELKRMETNGEGPFDLFFIDADKDGYPAYLEMALKLSKPGTLILADNVVRNGQVANPADPTPVVQAIRKFNQALADNPRLESLIVPIIRDVIDGLSISIVKS